MPPYIDMERCKGCGICAERCPMHVFRFDAANGRPEVAFPRECWHCNCCVLDCAARALSLDLPLGTSLLYIEAAKLE